jgi:hypothetical protein
MYIIIMVVYNIYIMESDSTNITKIILWGHKLHSHTHSYIHNGFYLAAKYLNIDTYWFDDDDDVSNFDFSFSLFITEHQVDNNIPKLDNCIYFVHYTDAHKYDMLPAENIIEIHQLGNNNTINNVNELLTNVDVSNFFNLTNDNFEICEKGKKGKHIKYYMMWATDLTPNEIQQNIDNIDNIIKIRKENQFNFIGCMVEPWNIVEKWCTKTCIKFMRKGSSFSINNTELNQSIEDNIKLIQTSTIAPAFQRKEQLKQPYIPCRIFKNISYGRMGITNNIFVNQLFNNKLIYDPNIIKCIHKGLTFEKKDRKVKREQLINLMQIVKNKHTYVNRLQNMFIFINKYSKFHIS